MTSTTAATSLDRLEPALDPARILAELTLAEKASLTAGADVWTVPGIERVGLPPLKMTDGPNGARGCKWDASVTSLALPCGSALAATFDPELVAELGALAGREARQKRSRVLLAPTINLVRSPLYGRSFECYGEDPWLSGRLAAAFVTGVQSQGVATTPKHLLGNETEHDRYIVDSVIDERTMRQVYLVPFEWAIRHGGALGVMTSYNRLNGTYCSEDLDLLGGILRGEWGFNGFVVSDWFAAGDTLASLRAGLDVQMPGPDRFYGAPVADAIESGQAEMADLDAIITRRLYLHTALDAWHDDTDQPESADEDPADRDLVTRAAADAMVLCENNGVLPLPDDIAKLALIGPTAQVAHVMGGGSAQLATHRRITPAQVLAERLGDRLVVEPGCVIDKLAAPLRPDTGFQVTYFEPGERGGDPMATGAEPNGRFVFSGEPSADLGAEGRPFDATMTGTLTIAETGTHRFTMIQLAPSRVLLDGQVIIDGVTDPPPRGEAFFGSGSVEAVAHVDLQAGQQVQVTIEFTAPPGTGIRGVAVGHQPPIPTDLIERAAAAAAGADAAVVMVGTSIEWESEGYDRKSMDLPGDQRRLIAAVAAANDRTVVVVNAGAPVDMEWADDVAATLICWLGGQEMAPALTQVLFGESEPGGRLPVTVPRRIEHTPGYGNFPGESNRTPYSEGALIGYRWYDTRRLAVRFPFGHGGSYTSWQWGEPRVVSSGPARATVQVDVTNTGTRAGSDVVQAYLAPPSNHRLFKPDRTLVGAAKVRLEPGATATALIELNPRSFAHWDPANRDHIELADRLGDFLPIGGVGAPTEPGWYVDAGTYRLDIARSIEHVVHTVDLSIAEPIGPLTPEESLP